MNNNGLLKEFCNLDSKFKKIEELSETLTKAKEGEYLCIRLDGIGLSKKYLKDEVKNNKFTGIIWEALKSTYDVLHRKSPTNAQNIFLAVIICSDEVSIIFNSQKNYYEGRLFKIITTVASTFSSFFTTHGFYAKSKKNEKRISGSFDGRPLVFASTNEVINYMAYRYAIYIRNTVSKLLRLSGVPSEELYAEQNNNNILYYIEKINDLNLHEELQQITKEPVFFIPDSEGNLVNYKYTSLEEFLDIFPELLNNYNSWLTDKNN